MVMDFGKPYGVARTSTRSVMTGEFYESEAMNVFVDGKHLGHTDKSGTLVARKLSCDEIDKLVDMILEDNPRLHVNESNVVGMPEMTPERRRLMSILVEIPKIAIRERRYDFVMNLTVRDVELVCLGCCAENARLAALAHDAKNELLKMEVGGSW